MILLSILLTVLAVVAIIGGVPLALRLDEALPQGSLAWFWVTFFAFGAWVVFWGGVVAFAWTGLS